MQTLWFPCQWIVPLHRASEQRLTIDAYANYTMCFSVTINTTIHHTPWSGLADGQTTNMPPMARCPQQPPSPGYSSVRLSTSPTKELAIETRPRPIGPCPALHPCVDNENCRSVCVCVHACVCAFGVNVCLMCDYVC